MNISIIEGKDMDKCIKLFNQRSWLKQGTWPGAFLWFTAILESFSEEWTGQVLDSRLAIKDYACIGQLHGAFDCLIGMQCFQDIREVMEQGYAESGPMYFQDYAKLCQKKCDEWLDFSRYINGLGKDYFEKCANDELAKLLREYFIYFRQNGAFMDTIIVLADLLGDVIGKSIDQLLEVENINNPMAYRLFIDTHSPTPRPTNVILADKSLRQMAQRIFKSPKLRDIFMEESPKTIEDILEHGKSSIYQLIQSHISRFGWLSTYSFTGEPLTIEQIIKLLQERVEQIETVKETLFEHDSGVDLKISLRRIGVPNQLKEMLKVTRSLTYVNAIKDDVHQITWRDIQPLLNTIAHRLECTIEDLTFCTPGELEDAIIGEHLKRGFLEARRQGWALLKTEDAIYILQGNADLNTFKGTIKSVLPKNVDRLVGKGVFPGLVRGKARLVLTSADCNKVKAGDILVATNTSPDFIPAMHRSAAFVTDTGNLICHAVIAAREFQKPCVISTQIATQVLVDGELIEVDGGTGIVTREEFHKEE